MKIFRNYVILALASFIAGGTATSDASDVDSVGVYTLHSGQIYVGGDPQDRYERFRQLGDKQIQKVISLTDEQKKAIESHIATFVEKVKEMRREEKAGRLPYGTVQDYASEYVTGAGDFVDELLHPEQQKRLLQCMYRLEAKRIGLGEALTTGRLSLGVGVYENQKSSLADKAAEIEAETQAAIREIKARAEERLLAELSPEQRKKAEDLLGEQLDYELLTSDQRAYRKRRAAAEEEAQQSNAKVVNEVAAGKKTVER